MKMGWKRLAKIGLFAWLIGNSARATTIVTHADSFIAYYATAIGFTILAVYLGWAE